LSLLTEPNSVVTLDIVNTYTVSVGCPLAGKCIRLLSQPAQNTSQKQQFYGASNVQKLFGQLLSFSVKLSVTVVLPNYSSHGRFHFQLDISGWTTYVTELMQRF
jgi:hypothetical protein